MLEEVNVFAFSGEEKFKKKILHLQINSTIEEVHAKNNIEYAHKLCLMGVVPGMNSEDNYKYYLNRPQGVSLFSTNPSKGLVKAIKNIKRASEVVKMNQSPGNASFPVHFTRPAIDSTVPVSTAAESTAAESIPVDSTAANTDIKQEP